MILQEIDTLNAEWNDLLKPYLDNGGRENLDRLDNLLASVSFHPCIPKAFRPLKCLKPSEIKVVIVGQDPYPQRHLATGNAFSYPLGEPPTNSVENIYCSIIHDVEGSMPSDGNLDYLVEQGVWLINRIFTFSPEGTPNLDEIQCRWQQFSLALLKAVGKQQSNLVFLLWGRNAQEIKTDMSSKHRILCAPHPSPKNENGIKEFLNCKHFSQTNEFLQLNGKTPIDWLK